MRRGNTDAARAVEFPEGCAGTPGGHAATAAEGRSISWLLDPAVLDALGALAAGNPARLTPNPASGDGPTSEATTEDALETVDVPNPLAGAWLDSFRSLTGGGERLALSYGDVDADAASRFDPELLTRARTRSDVATAALGISAGRVLSGPSGYLSPEAIAEGIVAHLARQDGRPLRLVLGDDAPGQIEAALEQRRQDYARQSGFRGDQV